MQINYFSIGDISFCKDRVIPVANRGLSRATANKKSPVRFLAIELKSSGLNDLYVPKLNSTLKFVAFIFYFYLSGLAGDRAGFLTSRMV
jgi:hypothetical protein